MWAYVCIGVCNNARNYILMLATKLSRLESNCLTCKYSKNIIIKVYYKKVLPSKCTAMLLCIFYYSKIVNTGHQSYLV